MKRYSLLRTVANLLEAFAYIILVIGVLPIIGYFAGQMPNVQLYETIIFLIIWAGMFAYTLAIAQIIKVCLHSYDNTEKIISHLSRSSERKRSDDKEDTPLSRWLKNNPGKGINEYYS